MRYVKTTNLNPGMVLAEGLKTVNGMAFIQGGTLLSQQYIDRLSLAGYEGVLIRDNISMDINYNDRFNPYTFSMGSDAVKDCDIDTLISISTDIVDDVIKYHPKRISILSSQSFDDYLFCHSVNTAIYSTVIGHALGLDRQGLYLLAKAAIFHDIGMSGILQELHGKQEELDSDDLKLIEGHVEETVNILKEKGVSQLIIKAVEEHHENENGSGYPKGLSSDQISDFAKIIHAATTLDAMTTRRPYKNAYTVSEVLDYFSSGSGILFHPAVVKVILEKFDAYPIGTEITLSNGQRAVVVDRTENNYKPVIILLDGNKKIDMSTDPEYQFVVPQSDNFKVSGETEENSNEAASENDDSANQVTRYEPRPRKEKKTIVVVDDTYIFRRTVESALNQKFNLVSFDNAIQALGFIRRSDVDLVLMDIEMPGMNGVEAVRELRRLGYENLPVIFLTAVNDKSVVMQCLSVHALDYILKPVKQIYVYERVLEALKRCK